MMYVALLPTMIRHFMVCSRMLLCADPATSAACRSQQKSMFLIGHVARGSGITHMGFPPSLPWPRLRSGNGLLLPRVCAGRRGGDMARAAPVADAAPALGQCLATGGTARGKFFDRRVRRPQSARAGMPSRHDVVWRACVRRLRRHRRRSAHRRSLGQGRGGEGRGEFASGSVATCCLGRGPRSGDWPRQTPTKEVDATAWHLRRRLGAHLHQTMRAETRLGARTCRGC